MQKMITQIQNMPPVDYSQISEPVLSEPKEQIENTIMELYNADSAVISSTGMFKYDEKKQEQILISQWVKATFLNSQKIVDPKDEKLSDDLALEIGLYLKPRISNLEEYDKMEIIFINEHQQGSIKQRIHLSIPDLSNIN